MLNIFNRRDIEVVMCIILVLLKGSLSSSIIYISDSI
jgi:hypothetical protein